ncbi:MAG: hypothetical protein P8Z38_08295 [Robiginitalea sp.]
MRIFKTLLPACLFTIFLGCTSVAPPKADPVQWIPGTTGMVLRINETEQFRSDYRNSPLFKSLLEYQEENRQPWQIALDTVLALDPPSGSLLVTADSIQPNGAWLLLIPDMRTETDSLKGKGDSKSGDLSNEPAWQLPGSAGLHLRVQEGIGMLSPSEAYLDYALEQKGTPPPGLERALRAASPLAQATLLQPPGAPDPYLASSENLKSETARIGQTWTAYDIQSGSGSLLLQSMKASIDSTSVMERLLRRIPTLPLQRISEIIPAETNTWVSYSLDLQTQFLENQQRTSGVVNPNPDLLRSVEQLSLLESGQNLLLVLHTTNAAGVEEALRPLQGEGSEFQGILVFPVNENNLLRETFAPLLDRWPSPSYYCVLEDTFIFSKDLEGLQSLISAHNRKTTYASTPRFEKLKPLLAAESSSLFISENPGSSRILQDSLALTGLPAEFLEKLPEGYLATTQMNLEDDFSLHTYQFRDTELLEDENPQVTEVFTAALEAPAYSRPQFLKNHRTGEMDVVVQDENNTLYLFSNDGSLFWKKTLPGPIQGDIHQVDLYRNGRLQMAFTTNSKLMVLDRNGKEVSPFPKDFPGGNLGPLAVFDYEQNRNYRLVVTQGNKVFMFDGQGRDVRGFKFREAASPVISVPKHIRIGSRDYLVFQLENGELKILNRVGDTRVPVRERFEFSPNPVFLYRDGFAFTERDGNLIRIDPRGRVSRTVLNLNPEHGMDATIKTLAFMDDNRFQVKGNKRELELGVYTRPRIFYLFDIIYVAVTDLQSQQVFLLRSTGATVPGFPVEGSGPADMADMDNGRNPELVVPFRDNAVRVYRIRR